jgi:flagellar biosynthesis protein FlhF
VHYQTFRGADLREALNRVKAAFGPDAVIESTRQISNGMGGGFGHSFVEVTATGPSIKTGNYPFSRDIRPTEEAPAPLRALGRVARGPVAKNSPNISLGIQNSSRTGALPTPPTASELDRELRALRAMLEDLRATRKPKERALAILLDAGFEGPFARELTNGSHRALKQSASALTEYLLERIQARLRVLPGIIARPKRQLIACIGPSGAGKTTTLAKLAARARLEHSRSVGIVSLDTYRVGAVEQWQRYAHLLGIPFSVARSRDDFDVAVKSSNCDMLLVDTSGRGATDEGSAWPLLDCLPVVVRHELHVLLVLPAWLRARDAELLVRNYSDARPTGAVFTKTDETVQQGGVLQAVLTSDLPITYTCNGPRVPEDIRDASPEIILKGLLKADA